MDLHAWITQQVDRAEAGARDALDEFVYFDVTDDRIAQHYQRSGSPETVLRRCEADRRILARRRVDPTAATSRTFATACDGCRSEWVQDDCEPLTDNINDCPELLDLAHAHGLTDEILAGLDRPQPPEPTPAQKRRLRERARLIVPITTSDGPEALRGPRRK
ncbi:hypothetical protein [Streptomyces sp. NPDC055243]|uniref:hypothetical protein n=1 Tax=Streptomyces sp. NPDC055243 TaxID=3365720 RepID=UPI0037D2E6EA